LDLPCGIHLKNRLANSAMFGFLDDGAYLRGLGERRTHVPLYAAPARNVDFAGLPPAISFVGDLDPLADEMVDYMRSLSDAGMQVAFKVFTGWCLDHNMRVRKAEWFQGVSDKLHHQKPIDRHQFWRRMWHHADEISWPGERKAGAKLGRRNLRSNGKFHLALVRSTLVTRRQRRNTSEDHASKAGWPRDTWVLAPCGNS